MKTITKILVIFAFVCIILGFVFSTQIYAITAASMIDKARTFVSKGEASTNVDIGSAVEPLAGFGSILTTVGVGILVIVTIVMGIRYITATPETQGKLKQQLIGLVVAAFVIFGSYAIWKLVVDIVKKL